MLDVSAAMRDGVGMQGGSFASTHYVAKIGVGFDAEFRDAVSLSLTYEGSFDNDIKSNGVMLNLGVKF